MDSCPCQWFNYHYKDRWYQSINCIAEFVHSNPNNLVFIPNVTTGINTVLRSLHLQPGQSILVTTLAYGAIYNTAQGISTESNCNLVVLDIKFPVLNQNELSGCFLDDIVKHYRNILEKNPSIRVAIIDYITSPSSVLLPVKELIHVCREKNVLVVVDGAHIHQVKLSLIWKVLMQISLLVSYE